MRRIVPFLLIVLFFVGCKNQKGSQAEQDESLAKDSLVQKYENEYFSIMCPRGWTSEWEEYKPETEKIASVLKEKGIKGGAVELWAPDARMGIRLVKSVIAWISPDASPRRWLQLSMIERQDEEDCIGMSDITDSMQIDGYDASEITFTTLDEGDTLMVAQWAVVPKPNELYFVCLKYSNGDNEAIQTLLNMLHTLHLKVKE